MLTSDRPGGLVAVVSCAQVVPFHNQVSLLPAPPNITVNWRTGSQTCPWLLRAAGDVAGFAWAHPFPSQSQVSFTGVVPLSPPNMTTSWFTEIGRASCREREKI